VTYVKVRRSGEVVQAGSLIQACRSDIRLEWRGRTRTVAACVSSQYSNCVFVECNVGMCRLMVEFVFAVCFRRNK
jgi:hypothetical protein